MRTIDYFDWAFQGPEHIDATGPRAFRHVPLLRRFLRWTGELNERAVEYPWASAKVLDELRVSSST